MEKVIEVGRRVNITTTTTFKGWSALMGVFCSTSSSGTLTLADSQGNICNTLALEAGRYYPLPFELSGDLTATVGGTADITIGYR